MKTPYNPHHLLPIALLTLAGLAANAFAADPTVIAQSGDTELKAEDIRPYLEGIGAREKAAILKDPSLLNQSLKSLLVQQLLLKEALAKKWDQQPAVQAQIENAKKSAIVQSYLQSVAKIPDTYPSAEELQKLYEANKAALRMPKQFRVAQIFIELPANSDKAATEKVQSRLDAIDKSLKRPGADFSLIATAENDDPATKQRAGEIGWLSESQMQPEIRPAVSALAKGGVSAPIKMDDGWHIVKVLDIKDAYTPTLDEIREPFIQRLRAEQTKATSEAYLAKIVKDNPMAINELAISKLVESKEK